MSKLKFHSSDANEVQTHFCDILLPVPIPKPFTYRIPRELEGMVNKGMRVIVQFGKSRVLTGIVLEEHSNPPSAYEAKYILEVLDSTDSPSMVSTQLNFFHWIASYYMCSPGEVMNVGLPSGLKLSSESRIQLHPGFIASESSYPFTNNEKLILDVLEGANHLNYAQVSEITGLKSIFSLIKSLVQKDSIILYEEVKDKYTPKVEKRVRISEATIPKLESTINDLESKPKQLEVLLFFLKEIPVYQKPELNEKGVSKSLIVNSGVSASSLNTLIKNQILEEFQVVKSRFEFNKEVEELPTLSDDQSNALKEIHETFDQQKPALLHGITGSGKTEIYIHLIQQALDSGSQVLYLLPEIALTTQIVDRLQRVFGDRMGVYHSKFSDNERVEIYQGVLHGTFDLIVGVRSSIFLPYQHLGLVIVDEEHESSYKQAEPAPRYHARDAALYLARLFQAHTVLGSATPSLESYFHASNSDYGLIQLHKRYGESELPQLSFANLALERKRKTMRGEFTSTLLDAIQQTINNGLQVIVFQNRRGYAPYLHCETCGWIPHCQNCSVSLTYHMYRNELRCHYCGYREPVPHYCHECGADTLQTRSFGTEKLEEDLKLMLKDARVARMDLDTTRSKFGYKTLLERFEKAEVDVLVGTQMVSKGLDFENVSLVGIVDADRMINFPNFRAVERTFQLITQVSGRAGRRRTPGTVIVQTYNPEQSVLKFIQVGDYRRFFESELYERETYRYPPFFRLISITFKHRESTLCAKAATTLYKTLESEFGSHRILGPKEGLIAKIRNQYIWEILIKFERSEVNIKKAKEIVANHVSQLKANGEFKKVRIIFDVDPY